MTIVLTNFSDDIFYESRQRLNKSAMKFGISEIYSYSRKDIEQTQFYIENKNILSQPRGSGYWLWKPYIILESLNKIKENDILIYSDAGIEIVQSLAPLVKICAEEQSIVIFANGDLINAEWTKRDCFILLNCDTKDSRKSRQCDGAFLLFKKTNYTVDFVKQWLEYGKDPRMFTDIQNVMGKRNSWRFIEHRHDQSVLSLMAYKENLKFFRMPTQFGNHYKSPPYRIEGEFNVVNQKRLKPVTFYASKPFYNSPYFQLLDQHRSRTGPRDYQARSIFKKIESRLKKWL